MTTTSAGEIVGVTEGDGKPADFTCAICQKAASNRWNWSAKDYERPPICKCCERGRTGWPHSRRNAQPPSHGQFRDRREAMRLFAVADALAEEAARTTWSKAYAS